MRFAKAMESRTDSELHAIISDPAEDWEPEAIVAAREELRKRELVPAENAGPFRTSAVVHEADDEEPEADEVLSLGAKGVAFLVGFLIGWPCLLIVYVVGRKAKKGEQRRSKERLQWVGIGFGVQLVVFFLFKSTR